MNITETLKSVADAMVRRREAVPMYPASSIAWSKAYAALLALIARIERIHAKEALNAAKVGKQ